jgi:predicted nucleic acid-binding protein
MSPPAAPTVFDTSAVIGLVERRSPALIEAATQLGQPIMRSATVCGELQHGAAITSPGQAERARTLDRYLHLSAWPDPELDLEIDELARLYGVVSAASAQPDLRAGMNDRWVIAECLAFGAGLVTADARQSRLATAVAEQSGFPLPVTLDS